jgi:hypothetical protein
MAERAEMPQQFPYSRVAPATEQERQILTEAEVAAVANPLALGMAAIALPLFIWSAINAAFYDQGFRFFVIPAALFYGGLVSALAGMWAFRKHDELLATVLGSLAAFWTTYGALLWMQQDGFLSLGASEGSLLGTFFVPWTVLAASMFVVSLFRRHWALSATLLGIALTFLFVCIGHYAGGGAWLLIGGWLGLISAVLGWYTSFATLLNAEIGRTILPAASFRLGPMEEMPRLYQR